MNNPKKRENKVRVRIDFSKGWWTGSVIWAAGMAPIMFLLVFLKNLTREQIIDIISMGAFVWIVLALLGWWCDSITLDKSPALSDQNHTTLSHEQWKKNQDERRGWVR